MPERMAHDASDGNLGRSEMGRLAAIVAAAWAVPGLGHILLGRVQRGLLFALLIWASFALGLAHQGRLALRDPRQPILSSLQVIANLGVGPADAVARLIIYGKPVYRFQGAPDWRSEDRVERVFRERARSGVSIYGTAYLWTAGLMNLLLLFDVWDIGTRRKN
jgi:hypothetical protein